MVVSEMKNFTQMLILASNSPRRIQLLREAGFVFNHGAKHVDESFEATDDFASIAEKLAIRKNQFHREFHPDSVVITADTTVVTDNGLLEKASSEKEARDMLMQLSGKKHHVITGVCISSTNKTVSFSDSTLVEFKDLSSNEISYYIENWKPYDKAGAYGIQEWIGMIGIMRIEGSYFNVVGLPIHRVYDVLLNEFGISPLQ